MSETDMVERVARALHKHFGKPNPRVVEPLIPWDSLEPKHQAYWESAARAAIEAMREPTEAMIAAGADPHEPGQSFGAVAFIWSEMIDAALSKGEME